MKNLLLAGCALSCAAVALSGCGTAGLGLPGGADQAAILSAVNAHIEGCERHYHGQTVPPSLSVQIDCPARPAAVMPGAGVAPTVPPAPT